MVINRPGKRPRGEDITEDFFRDPCSPGSYLKISLKNGTSMKSKGWPWVQSALRGVLGREKVDKANLLRDGYLLVKTKNQTQTDKLLQTKTLMNEECSVVRDPKLNMSKGKIHAYDLQDLSEDEIVQWLSEFGVVGAKRFTRRVDGKIEQTPTLLLTFDMPTCPQKLELDYTTYHVQQHIPNPLTCYRCGGYGHPEVGCKKPKKCLRCGEFAHDGQCSMKCLSCGSTEHSCLSHQCPTWKKEKTICSIKVEQEVSYAEARRRHKSTLQPPDLQPYSKVVRYTNERKEDSDLKEKVDKLEKKIDELSNLLLRVTEQLKSVKDMEIPKDQGKEKQVEEPKDQGKEKHVEEPKDNEAVNEEMDAREAITDSALRHVSMVRKEAKQAEWQLVENKKTQKKGGKVTTTETDMTDMEDDDLSQPIVRRCRSLERGNQTQTKRKSWKEK